MTMDLLLLCTWIFNSRQTNKVDDNMIHRTFFVQVLPIECMSPNMEGLCELQVLFVGGELAKTRGRTLKQLA